MRIEESWWVQLCPFLHLSLKENTESVCFENTWAEFNLFNSVFRASLQTSLCKNCNNCFLVSENEVLSGRLFNRVLSASFLACTSAIKPKTCGGWDLWNKAVKRKLVLPRSHLSAALLSSSEDGAIFVSHHHVATDFGSPLRMKIETLLPLSQVWNPKP